MACLLLASADAAAQAWLPDAGFYAATSLHQWIPRTYLDLRTNYAFVGEVADDFFLDPQ